MIDKKVIRIMIILLTIVVVIGELWDPTYLGGFLLGFLLAYNVFFWIFSDMMDNLFKVARSIARTNEGYKRKIEELEALTYFANLVPKRVIKKKRRAKK